MRHNPGYGIMTKFVQGRAVIVDLISKSWLRGNLHKILADIVKGFGPARPKVRCGRCNQSLGLIVQFALRKRRGFGGQSFGQAIALRGVEYGKAFEKRNRARRIAPAFLLPILVGGEAVGVKDCPALLALADASASGQGLPECQPVLRGITAINDRAP